ncbi:MAG: hypothetical protein V1797_15030 [Pseudomonadota bacterium]
MRVSSRKFGTLLILLCLLAALAVLPAWAGGVKSTDYFNLHYESWSGVAEALEPYLNSAFSSGRDVLGYDNTGYGKIDIYFYSDSKSSVQGYTYAGENAFYLNISHGSSLRESYLSEYGQAVAHETAHVLFFHKTKLNERFGWNTDGGSTWTWLTEALSYYVGGVVYPMGSQYDRAYLSSMLNYYSKDGSQRTSWLETGKDYKYGTVTDLELVQLETIGYFLSETYTWGGLHNLLNSLATSTNFENTFKSVFGRESGQNSTNSGNGTLYSEYLKFYLGHY